MIHREVIYQRWRGFRPVALDLYLPDDLPDDAGSPPLVIWTHGGGFNEGDRRSVPRTIRPRSLFGDFNEAGLACASIDYRLSGEAPWPAQRDDVDAAIDFLAAHAGDYGYDASRIGTGGDSAGGHLALMAAMTNPRVKAAAAWCPLTDISMLDEEIGGLPYSPWLGAVPSTMPERMAEASPITYVSASSPPCLFLHGEADTINPPSQSLNMHRRLLEAGVESVCRLVPGTGHNFEGYHGVSGLVDETVDFLRTHLR